MVIVGGGLSGSIAAAVLGRRGYRVALVDRHETYPPDFRAEQIVGPQIEILKRLDLFEAFARDARPVRLVLNARAGRLVDRSKVEHYGLPYEAMVAAARSAVPAEVDLRIGRVTAIEAGPERQRVLLSAGNPSRAAS